MIPCRVKTSVLIICTALLIPLLLFLVGLVRSLWDISAITPVEETLSFTVSDSEVRGECLFRYSSNSPRQVLLPLIFPFPVDSEHPFPSALSLRDETGRARGFVRAGSAICFTLAIPPGSTGTLRLSYRQQTGSSRSFGWIIAMNDFCRRPLQKALYSVTVPAGHQMEKSSPEPVTVNKKGAESLYLFSLDGAAPEKGGLFSFSWGPAEEAPERSESTTE